MQYTPSKEVMRTIHLALLVFFLPCFAAADCTSNWTETQSQLERLKIQHYCQGAYTDAQCQTVLGVSVLPAGSIATRQALQNRRVQMLQTFQAPEICHPLPERRLRGEGRLIWWLPNATASGRLDPGSRGTRFLCDMNPMEAAQLAEVRALLAEASAKSELRIAGIEAQARTVARTEFVQQTKLSGEKLDQLNENLFELNRKLDAAKAELEAHHKKISESVGSAATKAELFDHQLAEFHSKVRSAKLDFRLQQPTFMEFTRTLDKDSPTRAGSQKPSSRASQGSERGRKVYSDHMRERLKEKDLLRSLQADQIRLVPTGDRMDDLRNLRNLFQNAKLRGGIRGEYVSRAAARAYDELAKPVLARLPPDLPATLNAASRAAGKVAARIAGAAAGPVGVAVSTGATASDAIHLALDLEAERCRSFLRGTSGRRAEAAEWAQVTGTMPCRFGGSLENPDFQAFLFMEEDYQRDSLRNPKNCEALRAIVRSSLPRASMQRASCSPDGSINLADDGNRINFTITEEQGRTIVRPNNRYSELQIEMAPNGLVENVARNSGAPTSSGSNANSLGPAEIPRAGFRVPTHNREGVAIGDAKELLRLFQLNRSALIAARARRAAGEGCALGATDGNSEASSPGRSSSAQ